MSGLLVGPEGSPRGSFGFRFVGAARGSSERIFGVRFVGELLGVLHEDPWFQVCWWG